MAADPISVPPNLTVDRLVEDYVLGHGFRSFPVTEAGRAKGLVTLDAIRRVPRERRAQERVGDHLEPLDRARCVTPRTPLPDALALMARTDAERLLVLRDGSDQLVGLLTRSALARFVEIRQTLAPVEA